MANLSTPDHPHPYLDALVLHSPFPTTTQTLEALNTLNFYLPTSPDLSRAGKILHLGISNITPTELHALTTTSPSPSPTTIPTLNIIQNRLRAAEHAWDLSTRSWCASRPDTTYQGFWTLTGNSGVWPRARFVGAVAEGAGISRAAAWYVLLMEARVTVLNGTGDAAHMREDLDALGRVREWRGRGEEESGVWEEAWREFGEAVGLPEGVRE